jgi:hypothetical protein
MIHGLTYGTEQLLLFDRSRESCDREQEKDAIEKHRGTEYWCSLLLVFVER